VETGFPSGQTRKAFARRSCSNKRDKIVQCTGEQRRKKTREEIMSSEFTRREALVLGVSAAAMAATSASAQSPSSAVKVADVPAPAFNIENGASLRMLRPVRFVQADEDVFRANAARFTEKTGVTVKVDFVGGRTLTSRPR
jgi:hypothetical protein